MQNAKIQDLTKPCSAPHEARLLRLCIDRAVDELQWRPLLDCSTAIDWTVDWYKTWHLNDKDLRSSSLSQIRNFKETAVKKGF